MQIIQKIRCPNCGSEAAVRHHLLSNHLTRTECPICDYLMVMCSRTGKVIEAYAPGIDPTAMASLPKVIGKPYLLPSHEKPAKVKERGELVENRSQNQSLSFKYHMH